MPEIRQPTDDDRAALAALDGLAFNFPAKPEMVVLDGTYCAYEGDELVATSTALPLWQWFGGRKVSCAGVASVAVAPEHRGKGLASQLMGALLAERRRAGDVLSTLYPANVQLYRKLGYEYGGVRPEMTVPLADLPAGPTGSVTVVGTERAPQLQGCFSRFAAAHNGPVEAKQTAYFAGRLLAWPGEGVHQRTVAVEGPGGVDGYASYFTTPRDSEGQYRLSCKHLVACTADALASLLGYFSGFANAANELSWFGPAHMPAIGQLLTTNGFALQTSMRRWMTRVLDVRAALEARGYPAVDGQCTIEVRDDLFPGNNGPWELVVEGGQAHVQTGSNSSGKPLTVNAFSALFTGQATPADLVLSGTLDEDDPRVNFLTTLFAGPAPWMPDFF